MRLPLLLVALLSLSGTGSAGEAPGATPPGVDHGGSAIVARLDPALLGAKPLAAPQVFAQALGIPRVITWASTTGNSGIAWGSTAAITAANAYVTYDGTTATAMVLNVPTGKFFSFAVNNVASVRIGSTAGYVQSASGVDLTLAPNAAVAQYIQSNYALGYWTVHAGAGGLVNIEEGADTVFTGQNVSGAARLIFDNGSGGGATQLDVDASSGWVLNGPDAGTYVFKLNGDTMFTISDAGATGSITATLNVNAGTNGDVNTTNGEHKTSANATGLQNTGTGYLRLLSNASDGASAVGVRLAVQTDLATAGAKILSLGDNNSAYSEKFAIDLGGGILLTNNDATRPASSNAYIQNSNGTMYFNEIASTGAFIFSQGGTSRFTIPGNSSNATLAVGLTIADIMIVNGSQNLVQLAVYGINGQTLDLIDANDYNGIPLFSVSATGNVAALTFKGATSALSGTAINWKLGSQFTKTLSGNTTFTFSNDSDGAAITVAVTTTGAQESTFPAGVFWSGGTEPSQTASSTDLYTFYEIGSTIYGSAVQNMQ